ncbi:methyltransferase family protein [Mesorhizobium sp. A556]
MTQNHGNAGFVPWPPLIYLGAIAASIGLGLLYPLPWIGGVLEDLLFAVGWLVLLAVLALWFSAIRTMIRAKTTLNPNGTPEHLITTGPFSVSRNPIYLANTLLLIGIGLVGGMAWFLLLAFAAAFATSRLTIRREEQILADKFGKRYREYAKRVRRWV